MLHWWTFRAENKIISMILFSLSSRRSKSGCEARPVSAHLSARSAGQLTRCLGTRQNMFLNFWNFQPRVCRKKGGGGGDLEAKLAWAISSRVVDTTCWSLLTFPLLCDLWPYLAWNGGRVGSKPAHPRHILMLLCNNKRWHYDGCLMFLIRFIYRYF